ncbi:MAG TPA: hypothetical protein VMF08_17810, partial [Candidatus Sulfotelmatobacter sp.]|nr:hypothetical protein [Candidatus Sulfotelmatobacter sp.]
RKGREPSIRCWAFDVRCSMFLISMQFKFLRYRAQYKNYIWNPKKVQYWRGDLGTEIFLFRFLVGGMEYNRLFHRGNLTARVARRTRKIRENEESRKLGNAGKPKAGGSATGTQICPTVVRARCCVQAARGAGRFRRGAALAQTASFTKTRV